MDEHPVVVVVGYPGAELLDIACLTTAFDYANRAGATPAYRVRVVTPAGGPIGCQSGLTLQAQGALERLRGPLDTVVVSGGEGHEAAAANSGLVAHVRRLAHVARRVVSVCTGASVLAATGLLDGRRATTHWLFADLLAATYPAVRVDPAPIYIRDGRVTTAAGVSSALDLALAFIEEDHGGELARQVARGLVTYLQRPGNQAQMSMFVAAPAPANDLIREVAAMIRNAPDADLRITALATRAGVSERHLTRLFLAHTGQTPARYVRLARTEAAARLLVSSRLSLARIAARCGFTSAETLRQAFVARYGVTPSHYRATQLSRPVGQATAATTAPNPNGTSSSMQNSANDLGTTSLRR
ncbi:GlxA family transcriptional regulator [Streptomyces chiangmaiensis]|uniref:GlxA family transcriptional regulator n=1 Tax=Streptomyces chiangmaiensis TaxID=766497 RepID=A0ABU7FQ52_9ACTN|nr:GlxA family transcriptional regulator [Streptomyces chiangmaiensis]MED7826123.1 GlxA family transcriptional regulator [Streptomyces chiangmaiensis]